MRTRVALLALTLPAFSALAQDKPAQPAAPAAAAPAAQAAAPVSDPKAKAVLADSAAAMKNATGMAFTSKYNLTGNIPVKLSAEAQVWFQRNAGTPSASRFYAKGTMTQALAEGSTPLEAFFDGARAVWVDGNKKEVVEKAVTAPDGAPRTKTIKQQLIPSAFFEPEPFLAEMNAQQIMMGDASKVDGVDCDVVRLVASNNKETRIHIGKADKMPRKIERISPAPGGSGVATLTTELAGFKLQEVKPAEFKIDLPAGYTKRVEAVAQPVQPTNVDPNIAKQPPAQSPPSIPKGGLDVGAAAPAWVMKRADTGANATLADQKGKVVVMGFWGSVFGDSRSMLSTLEETAKTGSNVAVFGVACREQPGQAGIDAAKRAFADAKCTFPLLVDGDASATDYKLRGFPSVAVIDPTGKVAAFFESAPSAADLKAAVDKAAATK